MEIPKHMHDIVAENLGMEGTAAYRRSLWATVLGLRPQKDGNKWGVLWGDNLQVGIAAFGDTPEEAMMNFDMEMRICGHQSREVSVVSKRSMELFQKLVQAAQEAVDWLVEAPAGSDQHERGVKLQSAINEAVTGKQ